MGHWLGIRLATESPNRDAIGAWIEVKVGDTTMRRELTAGGGHASGQLGWTHFGLGPSTSAQVRVRWPGGDVGAWMGVTADQFITVSADGSAPSSWLPPGG
jgi:hypothetical protein